MASTEPLKTPKEKSRKSLTDDEWTSIATCIMDEMRTRKSARKDLEERWSEVDRQISMKPLRYQSDPDWMPETELSGQAEALEVLTSDARRLIFPQDRPEWFTAKAALMAKDMQALNWQGFRGRGETPVEKAIAASTPQDFANKLTVAFLQNWHRQYDFRRAVDSLNGEAFKYGNFVGRIQWVERDDMSDFFGGKRNKKFAALVPLTMWNTYLDDSPAKMFEESIQVGPGIVRTFEMNIDDLRMAAKGGKLGWIPDHVKEVEDAMSKKSKKRRHVDLVQFDGDLIVPSAGDGDGIFLPAVRITVCEQGPTVVRYQERDTPFNPYIIGTYHIDSLSSAYATSPLVKSAPLQNARTRALMETMATAALHARPPGHYNPHEPQFKANGGPNIAPGAMIGSTTGVTFMEVGDPQAMLAVYQALGQEFENETGVNGPRRGQEVKSHTTRFANEQQEARGQVRTVDYVNACMSGALRTFLYMEYELAKVSGSETLQIPDFDGFVTASGENLPEMVEFEVTGAGEPVDQAQKRAAEIQSWQAVLQMEPLNLQTGGQPLDINRIQERLARIGFILNLDDYRKPAVAPAGLPTEPVGGAPVQAASGGIPNPKVG